MSDASKPPSRIPRPSKLSIRNCSALLSCRICAAGTHEHSCWSGTEWTSILVPCAREMACQIFPRHCLVFSTLPDIIWMPQLPEHILCQHGKSMLALLLHTARLCC